MKYRVIEKHGKFYPQVRIFFFWTGLCENGWFDIECDTLEEAKNYVQLKQKEMKENKTTTVWKS